MGIRLGKYDLALLLALAEHRVLTSSQMARLLSRSDRSLRGRLDELAAAGYLETGFSISSQRGRPDKQAALTTPGIALLKDRERLPETIAADAILPGRLAFSAHHRALNDFRVALSHLPRVLPVLQIAFLTGTSPAIRSTPAGRVFAADWLDSQQAEEDSPRLIPDGAFTIKHEPQNKTLLFFLEIDMGTESLASATRSRGDVRHKIRDYQAYFRSERYKRYEQAWQCQFDGFRVLFVTSPPARRDPICRTVAANPPSSFIWVADRVQLAARGLAAPIWSRGGRTDSPEFSILGPEVSRQVLEQADRPAPATGP